MKKIFLILVVITSGFSLFGFKNTDSYKVTCDYEKQVWTEKTEDYRYEKVFIDGKWWIIVYDEDGNIVNIYEDEE